MPPLEQVLRSARILLTGATGFLGKIFLYLLLRRHPEIERVYLLIRGDKKSSLNRFRREVLDSPVMAPLREQLGARFDKYIEENRGRSRRHLPRRAGRRRRRSDQARPARRGGALRRDGELRGLAGKGDFRQHHRRRQRHRVLQEAGRRDDARLDLLRGRRRRRPSLRGRHRG